MDASTNYYLLLGIYDPDDDMSGSSDADPEVMEPIRRAIRNKQLECSRASRNPRPAIQLEAKRKLDLLQHAEAALDTQAKREEQFDEADTIIDQTTARHLENFASKGFIAAPEINLIVDKIADETNYKPTPAAVRMSARRRHIEIRRTNVPRHGLTPLEPPRPASFKDYEAIRPHLAVCGVDDLYTFLGGSPRSFWHRPAAELLATAREQFEAMPRKHDTLTKASTKLFRCCMDQAFVSEQSKADYDAYLRYLEMTKVLAAAGESCAYTKTMESTNQAPHFIQRLREASGTAGTLISVNTAAGYLLWYCRAHDIACTPTQWHLDGNAPKTGATSSASASAAASAAAQPKAAPKPAETPRPWSKPNTAQSNTTQSNASQPNTAQSSERQPSAQSNASQPAAAQFSGWRRSPQPEPKRPSPQPQPEPAHTPQPQPQPQPEPKAAPQPFIFVTHSGERITITNASQLVDAIGEHTYETLVMLSSPNQLDPALDAWLRTLPDGDRLVSALLSEVTSIGRYLILQRMLAPSRPIHYRGIGLDQLQVVTKSCLEAGNSSAGRNEENDDWVLANQWLVGLLVTDRVIGAYDRLINGHPAFGHNEFDRDPAIPKLTKLLKQYLDVESALRGTRWTPGLVFRKMIEIPYEIALGLRDYSFMLDNLREDVTEFLNVFEELSTTYGYGPDHDMSTLVLLAQKAQSADVSQMGFVISLVNVIWNGIKELKTNLDNARKQRAPRPQQPQPADDFPMYPPARDTQSQPQSQDPMSAAYMTQTGERLCASCGAQLRPDAKFCTSCGAPAQPAQSEDANWWSSPETQSGDDQDPWAEEDAWRPSPETSAPQQSPDPMPANLPATFSCPKCGAAVYIGAKSCQVCRKRLHPWDDGRTFPGTRKNDTCPCGSGLKYKKCHGRNER